MKTLLRLTMFTLPLSLMLSLTTMAQAVTDSTHTATTVNTSASRDNNDHSNWGLLGLVGLIGLAGLSKRSPEEKTVVYKDSSVR